MLQMVDVCQVEDLVVGNIKDAQIGIVLEAGDLGQGVVGDVEFFELVEIGQAGYLWESVGLYRQDFELL